MPLGYLGREAEKAGEGWLDSAASLALALRSGWGLSEVCVPLHQAQLTHEMGVLVAPHSGVQRRKAPLLGAWRSVPGMWVSCSSGIPGLPQGPGVAPLLLDSFVSGQSLDSPTEEEL